jgi:cell division protein ZapA
MAQITITINSREYAIACEDGQELHIMKLSRMLDEKAKLLGDGANQISESMLLAMVGLLLADELSELKKGNASATGATIDNENLKRIDDELATEIKKLNNSVKMLANEINLL